MKTVYGCFVIALMAFVSTGVCGCYWGLTQSTRGAKTPEEVVERYLAALANNDYEGIETLLPVEQSSDNKIRQKIEFFAPLNLQDIDYEIRDFLLKPEQQKIVAFIRKDTGEEIDLLWLNKRESQWVLLLGADPPYADSYSTADSLMNAYNFAMRAGDEEALLNMLSPNANSEAALHQRLDRYGNQEFRHVHMYTYNDDNTKVTVEAQITVLDLEGNTEKLTDEIILEMIDNFWYLSFGMLIENDNE